VGKGWTQQMREMADHIGPYLTLLISEQFGGQQIYVAADPEKNVLRPLIGDEVARIMSEVYRRERLTIPIANTALNIARRARTLAAVRANRLTIADAARRLRSSRTYISFLINHTQEG
jgi:hypothetical protein